MINVTLSVNVEKHCDISTGKFVLKMDIEEYGNIQAEVFVFEKDLVSGINYFSHVASVAEISSLGKYQPAPGTVYYLDNNIELHFDSAKEAIDAEVLILNKLKKLKQDYSLFADLTEGGYIVVI